MWKILLAAYFLTVISVSDAREEVEREFVNILDDDDGYDSYVYEAGQESLAAIKERQKFPQRRIQSARQNVVDIEEDKPLRRLISTTPDYELSEYRDALASFGERLTPRQAQLSLSTGYEYPRPGKPFPVPSSPRPLPTRPAPTQRPTTRIPVITTQRPPVTKEIFQTNPAPIVTQRPIPSVSRPTTAKIELAPQETLDYKYPAPDNSIQLPITTRRPFVQTTRFPVTTTQRPFFTQETFRTTPAPIVTRRPVPTTAKFELAPQETLDYKYPVPDNSLQFPSTTRRPVSPTTLIPVTTTQRPSFTQEIFRTTPAPPITRRPLPTVSVTTTGKFESAPQETSDYQYPVPDNSIRFPSTTRRPFVQTTRIPLTTTQRPFFTQEIIRTTPAPIPTRRPVPTTEKIVLAPQETLDYKYSVPDNSLQFPSTTRRPFVQTTRIPVTATQRPLFTQEIVRTTPAPIPTRRPVPTTAKFELAPQETLDYKYPVPDNSIQFPSTTRRPVVQTSRIPVTTTQRPFFTQEIVRTTSAPFVTRRPLLPVSVPTTAKFELAPQETLDYKYPIPDNSLQFPLATRKPFVPGYTPSTPKPIPTTLRPAPPTVTTSRPYQPLFASTTERPGPLPSRQPSYNYPAPDQPLFGPPTRKPVTFPTATTPRPQPTQLIFSSTPQPITRPPQIFTTGKTTPYEYPVPKQPFPAPTTQRPLTVTQPAAVRPISTTFRPISTATSIPTRYTATTPKPVISSTVQTSYTYRLPDQRFPTSTVAPKPQPNFTGINFSQTTQRPILSNTQGGISYSPPKYSLPPVIPQKPSTQYAYPTPQRPFPTPSTVRPIPERIVDQTSPAPSTVRVPPSFIPPSTTLRPYVPPVSSSPGYSYARPNPPVNLATTIRPIIPQFSTAKPFFTNAPAQTTLRPVPTLPKLQFTTQPVIPFNPVVPSTSAPSYLPPVQTTSRPRPPIYVSPSPTTPQPVYRPAPTTSAPIYRPPATASPPLYRPVPTTQPPVFRPVPTTPAPIYRPTPPNPPRGVFNQTYIPPGPQIINRTPKPNPPTTIPIYAPSVNAPVRPLPYLPPSSPRPTYPTVTPPPYPTPTYSIRPTISTTYIVPTGRPAPLPTLPPSTPRPTQGYDYAIPNLPFEFKKR